MILNVQDRMYIIADITDWVRERWLHPPGSNNWAEHSTISTGVLNGIVRSIAKDEYITGWYKPRLKYWRLLKKEKPDLFAKIKLFIKENQEPT